MKRIFILLLSLLFVSLPMMAILNGDGYYRVKNVVTGRYISVIDNRGHIDIASSTADLGAIRSVRYFENVVSDPSTIIYFKKVNSGYNLTCQGTSTRQIIGYYMRLEVFDDGTYKAYGEAHGMRAYLGDENIRDTIATVVSNNSKTTLWYIIPVDQGEDSYFGVQPEFVSNGEYWATMYAGFPFSPISSEMKVYTITEVDSKYGVAVWKERTASDVPASTPVIIRCPSAETSGNKLDIHTSSASSIKSNLLKGTYFCNTTLAHRNVVENDTSTMRVLSTASDGSLCFVRSSAPFMAANKAYLQVPPGTPAELKIMDKASYETYVVQQKEREDSIRHIQDSIHHVRDSIASIVSDGYYRIRCAETGRYMSLLDDKGSVDGASNIADLAAIRTISDVNYIVSDPSTVFYVSRSDDGYTLYSQNTNTRNLFGEPIHFHCDTLTSNWTIWGVSDGWKWNLSDSSDSGSMGFVCANNIASTWKLLPVTMIGGQDIAVNPSIQIGRTYYQTYCASYSAVLTAKNSQSYYLGLVSTSYGAVVWQACNNKELPASTPLIIQSSSPSVVTNRLSLTTTITTVPLNNQLKSVWYNSSFDGHVNRIANDTATIRVLGKGSDGTLCFIRSQEEFLLANSAYISVPAGSPAELKVMNMDEYEDWVAYIDSINSVVPYSLITYYVDDVVYKVDTLLHGAVINPIPEPTKEGYSFSGWEGVPSSMPSYDIAVYGTFTINSYHVTYMIDDVVYSDEVLEYGSQIIPLDSLSKEGYTFIGWSEIPDVVPAHDVVIMGSFSINSYILTYYLEGEIYKQVEVVYGASIEAETDPEKEGCLFSGWEGVPDSMPAQDVSVYGSFMINGLPYIIDKDRKVSVYNVFGQTIRVAVDEYNALENLPTGVYVVQGRKYIVQ